MPNIKGAYKRMRQAEENRRRNVAVRTHIKGIRREALGLDAAPVADPQAVFRAYCSALDKAAKRGIIGKNTAIRRKARAAARLRKSAPAVSAAG